MILIILLLRNNNINIDINNIDINNIDNIVM